MNKILLALLFIALAGPAAAAECCRYRATITDCFDGDSCTASIELGLGISTSERIRLARIDAPELRGPERPEGLAARDFLRGLVVGKEVVLETDHDKRGKYGRLIADLWLDGENVSDRMAADGHAEYRSYR